ncbi:hypothetical protein FRB90_001993 [Tulasnella sp. 427]|nr:hypothetical protein FRB90_001993 [Tulasnella sp. 427]
MSELGKGIRHQFQNLRELARKGAKGSGQGRDVNGDEHSDIQAALVECTRLDRLSSFRMDPRTVRFVADTPDRAGGKATVKQAVVKYRYGLKKVSVAVKKLNYDMSIDKKKFAKQFIREVDIMSRLNHERIVKLIGFVEDIRDGEAWIIMPWEPNGNLADFLASGDWEIPERISLIQDMFGGLEYLHTRKPPIIHGDLKSMNILVGSDCHAIITDFDSARAIDDRYQKAENEAQDETTPQHPSQVPSPEIKIESIGDRLTLTGYGFSLRWAPPEVVNGKRAKLASDVWSAGWVCWEAMTDKLPFHELSSAGPITLMVAEGKVPVPGEETQLGQPSTPPLDGKKSGSKTASTALLQKLGDLHLSRDNYGEANAFYTRALARARLEENENAQAAALERMGLVYRVQAKYTQAEESYKLAQKVCTRIGNELGRANALKGLGDVHLSQGEYAPAEESYKLAQDVCTRIGNELGRANALKGLGDVYRLQAKYTEAEESYKLAQDVCTRIGDELGRANALNGLGDVYYYQGEYTRAEESHKLAQEVCTRIGDELGRGNALNGLGDVYLCQGEHTPAEESYKLAQEVYTRISNEPSRANALHGLGNVYRFRDKYTEAEESYKLAHELYTRIGNDGGEAIALKGLGDVYRFQAKYTEAEEAYKLAQEVFARIRNERGRANALKGLGDVYLSQGEYTPAEESYKLAKEVYARIGDELGRANALDGLGHVYRFQAKYTQAEESYKLAKEVFARIGPSLEQADTLRALGHIARLQGRHTEAADFYQRAMGVCSSSTVLSHRKDDCARWLKVVTDDLDSSLETPCHSLITDGVAN